MDAIRKFNDCGTLGKLSFGMLRDALYEDFGKKQDIIEIQAIRASDGKTVLRAGLNHIETSYECFSHPVCVLGEDDERLFVSTQGRKIDDRPYVQRHETIVTGSEEDVDAYLMARADEAISINIVVRSEDPAEIARRAEAEDRAREKAERAAKAADPGILAAETAAADAYGDHIKHAVNAIRKHCGKSYVNSLIQAGKDEKGKVLYNKGLLTGQTVRLRREDVAAGWNAYRDPRLTNPEREQLCNYLVRHKYEHELSVDRALYVMQMAYGYDMIRA